MKRLDFLAGLIVVLLVAGCEQRAQERPLQYSTAAVGDRTPVYRLVPHPLYNPQTISKIFQPLVDNLNHQLPGIHIEIEASRDYRAYEQKFRAREAEILMPNPWQTIEAMKVGYQVIAMWGDAKDFKGLIIVRKDAGIKTPDDLRGKVVSYPSPTAMAAAIMPQYFLHSQGIDINKDIQNKYVGSQESSIMNVYMGDSAAGGTWPPPWRLFQREHPDKAAELTVAWKTPSLVNNSVMVRDDVPPALRNEIRQAFLNLYRTPEGRTILSKMETSRFYAADDASYDAVRQYVTRFEKEVRLAERK